MKKLLSRARMLIFVVNIIAIIMSIVLIASLKFDTQFAKLSTIGLLVILNIVFIFFNYYMFITYYTINEEKLCIYYSNKKIVINKVDLEKTIIEKKTFGRIIKILKKTTQIQEDADMDAVVVYYLQNKDKVIFLPYDKKFFDDLIKYGYTISD